MTHRESPQRVARRNRAAAQRFRLAHPELAEREHQLLTIAQAKALLAQLGVDWS